MKENFEKKLQSGQEGGMEKYYRQVTENAVRSLKEDLMIIGNFGDMGKKKKALKRLKGLINKALKESK